MAKITISKPSSDEAKWRAESDARTLSEAEKIKADKGRHDAAKRHAKEQVDHLAVIIAEPKAEPKPKRKDSSMEAFVRSREKK